MQHPMTQPYPASDLSVLVVEDDEITRDVAQELLEQIGVQQVHAAQDGARGLKKLKALARVDVVVVDIYMPDMDGIEFISELAKIEFKGRIIIVSGVSLETLDLARQLADASGIHVVGAMVKPLRKELLAQALGLTPA